ncbi:hypothetical protein Acr_13g0015790 [Actinidia rufa]|uniref:Uncharacterized protein n=1 Tax=Actinidia rufa TaxID=165716 RepID=A0A7J0FPT5_9ERIC|nr:hypothetical protein Acr_13g0015790 [Actinidia rufa]
MFPYLAVQISQRDLLTRISNLQLYKGRSPIMQRDLPLLTSPSSALGVLLDDLDSDEDKLLSHRVGQGLASDVAFFVLGQYCGSWNGLPNDESDEIARHQEWEERLEVVD